MIVMDLGLRGRRAVVTASSGGIGAAVAVALAGEGCAVLLHGRNAVAAEEVAGRVRETGAEVSVVLGDLLDDEAGRWVGAAALEFGAQILVNNAGPLAEHHWENASVEDWRAAFNGNVVTAARITQALLPSMRAHGWGRVVNIGSRAVVTPQSHLVEYSAAKAAVVNMTTSLAQHLAGSGITANCVSPGVISTPTFERMMAERSAGQWAADRPGQALREAEIAAEYAPNPTGRLGRVEEIAHAVVFLASPLAGYINGVNLRVDGGITGTP